MAELVDSGFRVLFDKDEDGRNISYAVEKNSGAKMEVDRRNNIYETEWQFLPWEDTKKTLSALTPFSRGPECASVSPLLAPLDEGPAAVAPVAAAEVAQCGATRGLGDAGAGTTGDQG